MTKAGFKGQAVVAVVVVAFVIEGEREKFTGRIIYYAIQFNCLSLKRFFARFSTSFCTDISKPKKTEARAFEEFFSVLKRK